MASYLRTSVRQRTPRTTCPVGLFPSFSLPPSPSPPSCLPVSPSYRISIPWGYSQRVSAITIAQAGSFRRRRVSIKMRARRDTAEFNVPRDLPLENVQRFDAPLYLPIRRSPVPRPTKYNNLYSNRRSFPHILP